MNKLAFAALAAMALSLGTTVASAGVVTPANDLIIGFQDESGLGSGGSIVPTNLEVDLGALSLYTTTYSATLSNVTLNDLVNIYSANWSNTSSGVFWSVAGISSTSQTFNDTSADGTIDSANASARNGAYNAISGLAAGMNDPNAATLADSNGKGVALGTSQNPASGLNHSYTYLETQNGSAGGFGFTTDDEVTGAGSIELYQVSPGGTTDLGTFSLGANGVLTYNGVNAAAVPEPSAYALGICAILLFLVLKRRHSVA